MTSPSSTTPASLPVRLLKNGRTLPLALALFAATVAIYLPVTRNGFLNFDDDTYLTLNPHVQAGFHWHTLKWAFTTFDAANYHPLTWLSHALDCQLFALDPGLHHAVNVLLHAANAVLLFLFLQSATGYRWRSLFVAALFALHPINVESVAWAAERKNVLSMFFFLLALLAYLAYTRNRSTRHYALVAFLFLLGLLSKPQVITFPFLLLLLDYWPLHRFSLSGTPVGNATFHDRSAGASPGSPSRPVLADWGSSPAVTRMAPSPAIEKIPLLLLSAASALVTLKAQKAGGAVQALHLYSPLLRLETALISYIRYLAKALWPTDLVILYPHPTRLYPPWQVAAATLLLTLISAVVLRFRDRRFLLVGWLWFLGSLFPMIGLVQVGAQSMADRYAYIPFIGLFLMLTWTAADLAQSRRAPSAWLAVPALAALLALAVTTYRQVGYWHDIPSFWTRTIELTDANYTAYDMLAEYLADNGQNDEAVANYRAALAIRPDDIAANLGVGTYEHSHGNLPAAIEHYKVVLNATDKSVRAAAFGNLGSAYRQLGDFTKAKRCYEASSDLVPNRSMPLIGLGLIAQKTGDSAEAIRQYSRAIAVEPTDLGYLLMADALEKEGRSSEAREMKDRAARLFPDLKAAQKQADTLLEH